MSLSNTAVPKYYGMFREAVLRGDIFVCKEISMEMNRIDALIADRNFYYDDQAVEGWIRYCEAELTLTDGTDLNLLDSFKLWGSKSSAGITSLNEASTSLTPTVMAGTMFAKRSRSGWSTSSI